MNTCVFFLFFEIERKREQIERDYVKVVRQVVRGDYFVCNREDVLYVYGNNGTEENNGMEKK